MHPNKITCTPIYRQPQEIRDEALLKLMELDALERSGQWVDDASLFLKKGGSFSHRELEEGSFKVCTQKASCFMANLVSPSRQKASPEERLLMSGRGLLLSLLAHAWLWTRPKVLDDKGDPVAFEERRVLAPQAILDFLGEVRAHKVSCTYKEIWKFLMTVQEIPLHEDTSKWNATGVIACLRWDRSHNERNGGPWCYCRLEKDLFPPPYHEVCATNSPNLGVARRFSHWLFGDNSKEEKITGCKAEMTKA
jgi:hypothetical protein